MKEILQKSAKPVALITGASSGLGWAVAQELARDGYDLCVFARRAVALENLASEVREVGARCIVVPGDTTSSADVERAVQSCLNEFGKIDVLVNNAAIQIYAKFEDYSWDEICRINEVNYYGYLRFARAVLPSMHARHTGKIINVLSVMEQGGLQYFSAYSAAKHALMGWSKCMKLELHGTGIQIANAILPAMNTPLYDHCETKLGVAPKPLPPIYDVAIGVKAIKRSIRHPNLHHTPAFLQGRLILWTDYFAPGIGNRILYWIGERGQRRRGYPVPSSNAWFANPVGVGAVGSLPKTPTWKRFSPWLLLLGIGALAFKPKSLEQRPLKNFEKNSHALNSSFVAEKKNTWLARSLIAAVFVGVGLRKLQKPDLYNAYMRQNGIRRGARPILYVAALTELLLGLIFISGKAKRASGLGLMAFLAPTTVIFHPFWKKRGLAKEIYWIEFMKNVAITGGLLYIFGASRRRSRGRADLGELR